MTKLNKLKELFEEIDDNIGIGPSEKIIDENKVDDYINNFINEFKNYKVFEMLSIMNENESKSYLERLNEF